MNANEHKYKQKLAQLIQFQDMISKPYYFLLQYYPDDYNELWRSMQNVIEKTDKQIEYLTGCIEEYDPYLKEA